MCACRRARVRLSPDPWSSLSRKHREPSLVTFFFFFIATPISSFILPLSASHTHAVCKHTAGSLEKRSTKWWLRGEARRPPLLGTRHPRCQECQLREWRDEGKGGGEAGKVWSMQRGKQKVWWKEGWEGQKGDRKERKRGKDACIGHSQASDSFLHNDEEEKSWLV